MFSVLRESGILQMLSLFSTLYELLHGFLYGVPYAGDRSSQTKRHLIDTEMFLHVSIPTFLPLASLLSHY
jgi:Neuraminidase (sialidase)